MALCGRRVCRPVVLVTAAAAAGYWPGAPAAVVSDLVRVAQRFTAHGPAAISSQHHLAAVVFTQARPMEAAIAIIMTVIRTSPKHSKAARKCHLKILDAHKSIVKRVQEATPA